MVLNIRGMLSKPGTVLDSQFQCKDSGFSSEMYRTGKYIAVTITTTTKTAGQTTSSQLFLHLSENAGHRAILEPGRSRQLQRRHRIQAFAHLLTWADAR